MIEANDTEEESSSQTSLAMQMPIHQDTAANHDEIASIAFILWDQAGRPSGRDLEFWLTAEQRVIAARQPQPDASVPSQSSTKASGFSQMDFSTERLDARSSSTGTNRPPQKNGANPTVKPAERPWQSRAKKATSSVT
jgi:hypothetical protein